MAFSKKDLFALLPQLMANHSKTLGHPARVKIILHLVEHGMTSFQDLRETVPPLSQSTVSQHMQILLRNNMVVVYEKVPHTRYGLNYEELRRYMVVTQEFLRLLSLHGIDPKDMIKPTKEYEGI